MDTRVYADITRTVDGLRCLHCTDKAVVAAVALIGSIRLPVYYCNHHAEVMGIPEGQGD